MKAPVTELSSNKKGEVVSEQDIKTEEKDSDTKNQR